MKYFIKTYGCQMNFSDSERIAGLLEQIGFEKASSTQGAGLAIINVCSIRQSAVNRAESRIKTIKKDNKDLKILITGCVLQKDKKDFEKLADKLFSINELQNLPKIIKSFGIDLKRVKNTKISNYLQIKPKYESSVSVSVPIMTGCNNFCSYCVVPYTRGREISRPAEDIIKEVKNLIKKGAKEIWLLGQNVNSYRWVGQRITRIPKVSGSDFAKLLKALNRIEGDFWIRFASSHPKDLNDETIETFAKCKKIAPYFNLPIQSGNNKILKAMNRPYTIEKYKKLIKKIRNAFKKYRQGLEKEIAISTDVIVGFPGETKKQFEDSKKIVREVSFINVFISRFSPRPLTPASKMKDNTSFLEKKQREKELDKIVKRSSLEFNKKFLGKIITVLILEKKENYYFGKSRHYQSVKIANENDSSSKASHNSASDLRCLVGKFIRIKITKVNSYGLEGKIEQ